jgi:carbon-monoxide dehydrogenase medium subunit
MSNDFTLVGVAAVIALDARSRCRHARVAVGGAAPHAFRATDAEAALQGEGRSPGVLARAGQRAAGAARPVGDHRGSAEYRREMVEVMAARAIDAAWERAAAGAR